jgi:hypothetical protein
MTADIAGTLAVALALDEPEQLLAYLKQQTIARAEAVKPIDPYLAKKWDLVGDELAELELKLQNVKRPTA